MLRSAGYLTGAIVLTITLCAIPTMAHDFPLNTVANSYVKIEPRSAHLVVRVPMDLLHSVHFAMAGSHYDLAQDGPMIQAAIQGVTNDVVIMENGTRLVPTGAEGRMSLPSDRSFENYDQAVQFIRQPMDLKEQIYFDQGYLDVHLVYPIQSSQSEFTIKTVLAEDLGENSKLTVRFMPLTGRAQAFIISAASGIVSLDPPWYKAAKGFVVLGISHILSGIDHLLFLLCLVIPIRRLRTLVPVITAFTVGHSATLIGTAYNLAPGGNWFPPFVEMAIAISILYMAVENILGVRLDRRWLIAGLFGLVHGFGFSYALKENLQFAGAHLLTSLLAFNVGIEIGQLLILTVMVVGLTLLFRNLPDARVGVVVLSAFVAHTAWHWMIERGQVFWNTQWPHLDAASIVMLSRWLAALLVVAGVAKAVASFVAARRPSIATASQIKETRERTAA